MINIFEDTFYSLDSVYLERWFTRLSYGTRTRIYNSWFFYLSLNKEPLTWSEFVKANGGRQSKSLSRLRTLQAAHLIMRIGLNKYEPKEVTNIEALEMLISFA